MLARELEVLQRNVQGKAGHVAQVQKDALRTFKARLVIEQFFKFLIIGEGEFAEYRDRNSLRAVIDGDHSFSPRQVIRVTIRRLWRGVERCVVIGRAYPPSAQSHARSTARCQRARIASRASLDMRG